MNKSLLISFLFLITFVGSCKAQSDVRHFREIRDFTKGHSGAYFALSCFDCKGAYSLMYETDRSGQVALSDTMLVWTQHYSEGGTIHMEQALKADMIIACFPNRIESQEILNRHAFPDHDNILVVGFHKDNIISVTATDSIGYDIIRKAHEFEIVVP